MNILIDDGMQIEVGTGIGNYTMHLYMALKKLADFKKCHIDQVELESFSNTTGKKSLRRLKYLVYINSPQYLIRSKRYDILHYTNFAIPFIRNRKSKYVVTVHDLATVLYKDTFPKLYGVYARFMLRHAIKNADVVLTDSESVKREINEIFPSYILKVRAVYPGVCDEINEGMYINDYKNAALQDIVNKKFFLCVGTVERRKNLGIVIQSFLKLKQNGQADDFKLVLAGRPGYGYKEYEAMIISEKYKEDIIITGYVSNEDCNKLYSETAAYIFPTVYEGFGLTQLECMAHHAPIILSKIPTNLEVSGKYGFFFNLNDEHSLIAQMCKIIQRDYDADNLNVIADDLISRFDWNKLVFDYVNAYEGECL